MYLKFKKIEEGFTIVETLIVLAIAALIITIVLIAVPNLQRSARNTNMLHDAQDIASAIQTFESNNQGSLPSVSSISNSSGTITLSLATTGGSTNTGAESTAKVQSGDIVTGTNFSSSAINYSAAVINGSTTQVGPGTIVVMSGALCGTTGSSQTPTQNSRAVAIFYPIESGGSGSVGCVQA